MYDELAVIYDRTGQCRFSLKMVSYMFEILALRRLKPRRVAEFACGTGAAAVAMSRRGFEVTAVDASEGMLARAKCRASKWNASVDWRRMRFSEIDLPPVYDLATCFYDSLNHLTEPAALRSALRGVRRSLAPGGHFFFDANTHYAMGRLWNGAEDHFVAEDYARFWRSRYDAETAIATLRATYFTSEPDGRYRRLDVEHRARGYDLDEVGGILRETGFDLVAAYDCFTFAAPEPWTPRIAYLART